MRKVFLMLMVVGLIFGTLSVRAEEGILQGFQNETIIFGFEGSLQGWEVPDWAYEKPDHVQREIEVSSSVASEGTSSMEIDAEFPGGRWTGAIVEIMQYFDWSDYTTLACDLYIPEDAPVGLKAKIILTVGDSWKWVEMSKAYDLKPGKWVTMIADLKPGSIDWRRVEVDDRFRRDIRKMDIRVESNNKPAYTGPIYIDNVRVMR